MTRANAPDVPEIAAADPALGELAPAWNIGGPEYLSVRLGLVAKLIERHTARMLAERFGVSLAEWRALAQVARLGPQTVRSLAELSWVDRAEASRATASLIAKKLVQQLPNPADGRSPYFTCTAAGLRLYRRIRPTRDAFQQLLEGQIPPGDRAAFLEVLNRMSRALAPGGTRRPQAARRPRGTPRRRRAA